MNIQPLGVIMALTALSAYLDPPEIRGSQLPFDGIIEYCRNEHGREIVRLFVIPDPVDGTQAGEEITIRLVKARRGKDEEVVQATKTYIFDGTETAFGVPFEFDLRHIYYSNKYPFPVVRRGMYFFDIEHSGGTTGPSAVHAESDEFRVTLMTTDLFEEMWLKGATRRANDDRFVRFQPYEITGVRIIEVSRNHVLNMFPLNFVIGGESPDAARFLSWDEGRSVRLDMSIPKGIHRQYTLPNRSRQDYIIVQVDPRKLPTEHVQEDLVIDRDLIKRHTLRDWLDAEMEWLERTYLHVPIEPALIVSDFTLSSLNVGPGAATSQGAPMLPENFDYDIKGPPITYYPPTEGHWINLRVPFWKPLKFEYLVGALENTRIIDIPVDWIHKGDSGFITLMPFNQSIAYHFIGLMHVHSMRGAVNLPSLWRYRYWAGIESEETPEEILEIIGMRAGVKALTVLGQMFRGGFSSQSVSRDGVSESVSYTASATYGLYSATTTQYEKILQKSLPQLKRRYYGVPLTVV